MAFPSQDNLTRTELSTPAVGDLPMWYGELNFPSLQQCVPNIMPVPECDHMAEYSPVSMALFSECGDVSDMSLGTCFSSITASECNHYNQLLEGENWNGLVSNFWSIYPPTIDNFNEMNGKMSGKGVEEPITMKVGKYSVEERKEKIMKYLKKRNQRNFNKTIKYACRKTLADKRVRVRGRFAKNIEPNCEFVDEENPRSNNYQNPHCQETTRQLYYDNRVQMKNGYEELGEDWLEEAMATLIYSPCLYTHS